MAVFMRRTEIVQRYVGGIIFGAAASVCCAAFRISNFLRAYGDSSIRIAIQLRRISGATYHQNLVQCRFPHGHDHGHRHRGKNGILLLDAEHRFRALGFSAEESMIQAGRRRLRPIAMTALATVAGMLPLAFGIGLVLPC